MNKSRGVEARIIKASAPIEKAETSTEIYAYAESDTGGFMPPPTDLRGYKRLVNHSSILPQCIKAYKSNIAGFGIGVRYKDDKEETQEMRAEWDKISEVLQFLSMDQATKEVFEDVIEARETYGIAYLEVLRNLAGEVVGVEFIDNIPSVLKTAPLLPYIEVEYEANGKMLKRQKKFCKYRQQLNGKTVYFKEMGDTRIMDNRTGEYTDDVPIEFQANELLEFAIGTEPYGEVRWIGTVLNVDGSRKAENLNNRYFSEGRHTPLMILINGGTLTDESFTKLQGYMNDIKGENGQHAFIVLEAENLESRTDMDVDAKPSLEVVKMADVLQKDELFQEYLNNNRRKVQSAFQLPDLYVGYTTDFNRATAQSAQEVTEKQVFQPERESLAWVINHKLLADYHFKYVEAYFLEPDVSNPDDLYKILTICNTAGGLTPNKAKEILYNAMGEIAEDYEGDWGNTPLAYSKTQGGAASEGLDQQLMQQVKKSVENNDVEITAVLKEIRALLIKSQGKELTFTKNSDIIEKGWVTTEDDQHIYIDSDGNLHGGAAAYSAYEREGGGTATGGSDPDKDFYTYEPKTSMGKALEEHIADFEYTVVKDLAKARTEDEIISKIAGRDKTEGSCASVALAYVGQKAGMDVEDYKGGKSQDYFSWRRNRPLEQLEGVRKIETCAKSDLTAANQLLRQMERGKEYYFGAGRHASIVRMTEDGTKQYLELQSAEKNGWENFGKSSRATLYKRFGCRQSSGYAWAYMYDVDQLINTPDKDELRYVLGCINTIPEYQQKGSSRVKKSERVIKKASSKTKFYKDRPTDKIYWVENKEREGVWEFSFDKKKIYNMFADYPHNMTEEEIEIFDKENPFWKDFFANRK